MSASQPRGAASVPTVSEPSAMRDFPSARNEERDALISLVELEPGMRVLDLQAAGGYLSDEIHRRLDGRVECVCIEPSAALRSRLNPAFTACADRVERFHSVADASIDAALGLVGLHHSRSHAQTLAEVYRVLKPGTAFAICEVVHDTPVARWLNEFVADHSAEGHEGNFVAPGELVRLLQDAGFTRVRGFSHPLSWRFASFDDVAAFFRGLFGLTCSEHATLAGVRRYFDLRESDGEVLVPWMLDYCVGYKPG